MIPNSESGPQNQPRPKVAVSNLIFEFCSSSGRSLAELFPSSIGSVRLSVLALVLVVILLSMRQFGGFEYDLDHAACEVAASLTLCCVAGYSLPPQHD